jgi:hypothetical protein
MGIFDFLTPKADGLGYNPMSLPAGADPENDPVVGYDELGQKIRRSRFDGTQYLFEMTPPKTQSVVKGAYREATANPLGFTGDLLSNAVQSAWDAISVPARSMAGEPITYGDIAGLTGMMTLGAGAATAPAGSLRMGAAREGQPPVTFADAERAMQEAPGNFQVTRQDASPEPSKISLLHSSPHDFNRFSMSQIGTGEGAQAYGHGLYFAESPSVSGRGGDYWKQFFNKMPSGPERTATGAMYANKFDSEKAASQLEANVRYHADRAKPGKYADGPEVEEGNRLLAEENQQALDMIRSGQIVGPRTYEVNINADPNAFLDWDKPLSEQPQTVRDALGPRIDELRKAGAGIPQDPIGESLWRIAYPQGGFDITDFSRSIPEQASERLLNAGIPGIKYLDAGSRSFIPTTIKETPSGSELYWGNDPKPVDTFPTRQAAEDAAKQFDTRTRNFVVFDDKLISIVRKYGIAGAAVMLGTSADQISQTLNENMTQEELNNLVSGA